MPAFPAIVHQISLMTELDQLKTQLQATEDFLERMEIEGKIHDIEVRTGARLPPKPIESDFECIGCSS